MMTVAVCVLATVLVVCKILDMRTIATLSAALDRSTTSLKRTEEYLDRVGVDIRALTRQRDIAVEQAREDAESYLRRIKALEGRLAPFERKRGPGGRIVGRA